MSEEMREKRRMWARKSQQKRYQERKSDPAFLEANRKRTEKYVRNNPINTLLISLRRRAKMQKFPFNITIEDIEELKLGKCPITNREMLLPWECGGEYHPDKASIDKIIPKLGYVPGNIQWLSMKGNSLKNDHTIKTLEATIKYIQKHKETK